VGAKLGGRVSSLTPQFLVMNPTVRLQPLCLRPLQLDLREDAIVFDDAKCKLLAKVYTSSYHQPELI